MKGNPRLDVGLLILRIGLGSILLIYGCQKMLGLFGGHGYAATISAFTGMGIPAALVHLSIAAEFFGSLGLILGFLTPVAAFGVMCNMAVATFMNARRDGALAAAFQGDPAKMSSVFFPTALFFMALTLLILGGGRYTLDAKFFRKK